MTDLREAALVTPELLDRLDELRKLRDAAEGTVPAEAVQRYSDALIGAGPWLLAAAARGSR